MLLLPPVDTLLGHILAVVTSQHGREHVSVTHGVLAFGLYSNRGVGGSYDSSLFSYLRNLHCGFDLHFSDDERCGTFLLASVLVSRWDVFFLGKCLFKLFVHF